MAAESRSLVTKPAIPVAKAPEPGLAVKAVPEEEIEVEALSICTPDLDDVFFALTGQVNLEGAAQ